MRDGPDLTGVALPPHEMKLAGSRSSRLLILAFSAFIALAASGALQWYMFAPSHDEQRAAQLVLLWVVGVFCFRQVLLGRAQAEFAWCGQHRGIVLALGTFFGIGLVSAALATLPSWAFLEWSHLFLLVVLCVALSIAIDGTAGAQDWLYLALVTAAVLYAVPVLAQYAVAVFVTHSVDNDVVVVSLGHRRFAAQMHAMLVPVLGALYFRYNARRIVLVRGMLLALAGFAWMLCFVAAARGAAVALAASVLALALLGRTSWLRWMKFYVLSLLIGVVLVGVLFVLLPDWVGATMVWENRLASTAGAPGLTDSPGRMFLWAKSLNMVLNSPLLGIGPMHFAYQFHNEGAHPHNLVLQLMAEWGPIAMLCFVGVLLYGYAGFGKFTIGRVKGAGREHKRQMTAEGIWAVLTIIAVYSLIDGLFVMPYSQMLIVLFAAWAMAIVRAEAEIPSAAAAPIAAPGRTLRAVLALAFATALFSVAIYGFPGIGKSWEREDAYMRGTGVNSLFPRFWVQGWIGPLPAQGK